MILVIDPSTMLDGSMAEEKSPVVVGDYWAHVVTRNDRICEEGLILYNISLPRSLIRQ